MIMRILTVLALIAPGVLAQQPIVSLPLVEAQNMVELHSVGYRDTLGQGFKEIGDFNGDGIDDFGMGVDNIWSDTRLPELFVVFGREDCFPEVINDANYFDGTNGVVLVGLDPGSGGYAVTKVGDVNQDGYDDLLWGSPAVLLNNINGRAFLVMGGPTWPASFSMAALDGTNGTRFEGSDPVDRTGQILSDVGDVNNDGINDFAIVSPITTRLRVVFGQTGSWPMPFDLETLDGTNGFEVLISTADGIGVGRFLETGDLDNDGIDDLLVPVYHASVGSSNDVGEVYLLPGRATWPGQISTTNATTVFRGEQAGGRFGGGVFTCDFDGDSLLDVVISARYLDTAVVDGGGAYVFFGQPGGFPSLVPAASLNGTNGFRIFGEWASALEVADLIGDMDGDGADDITMMSYTADLFTQNSGLVSVIHGGSGPYPASIETGQLAVQSGGLLIPGRRPSSRFAFQGAPIGDINADGYDDLCFSDYFGDPVRLDEGEAWVLFGGPTRRQVFLEASASVSPVPNTCGLNRFSIQVENAPVIAVSNVVVVTRLDPALTLVADNAPGGCIQTGRFVHCAMGNLPASGITTLELDVRACAARTYTNVFMAGGGQGICVTSTLSVAAPPSMTVLADPLEFGCGTPVLPTPLANLVVTSDCAIVATTVLHSATNANGCVRSYLRTVELTDECGRTVSSQFTVSYLDAPPPSLVCPPDAVLPCGVPPTPDIAFVLLNATACSGATVTVATNLAGTTSCAGDSVELVYTMVDACGTAVCTQLFTRVDATPPNFSVPIDIVLDCAIPPLPMVTGNPGGLVDPCGVAGVSFVDAVSNTCGNARTVTRSWQVWDSCGNTNTQVQIITLVDSAAPVFTVPGNLVLTVGSATNPPATGTITPMDSCGTPTFDYVDSWMPVGTDGEGTIQRTWRAWDLCGNTNSAVQVIVLELDCSPTNADPDDDDDGIPDVWEQVHGLDPCDPADAAADPDGDGCSTLEEYFADTDPNDDASVLRVVDTEILADDVREIHWPASTNRLYTIQETIDLIGVPWTDIPSLTDLPGVNGNQSVVLPAGSPHLQLRVRARVP